MNFLRMACLGLCGCLFLGCDKQTATDSSTPPAPRTFWANGLVKVLPADGKTVVIQHEAISNYMGAMTMPFEVHDTNLLRGVKTGDAVAFHLVVTEKEGWIDQITERAKPPQTNTGAAAAFHITGAVEPLDEGQLLPDYHFTNELGGAINLSQYKGQVWAFTFFFTSCPYPNFCPRITGNFAETAKQLAQTPGAPAQWHLFSISFDTKNDTPERLRGYAKGANYDPAHWSFLTGDPEQISKLADHFGQTFASENGSISHNIRTVVINPQGRVAKIFRGNEWTPSDLIGAMVQAAAAPRDKP